jgi:hypothetical protein
MKGIRKGLFQNHGFEKASLNLNIYGSAIFYGIVLCLFMSLTSCEGVGKFFSTSWGSGLERDQEQLLPRINAGNALELANNTAGDKKQAKLVAEKILDALSKTKDPAEQRILVNAGLNAANNASDLTMTIFGNIDSLLDSQVKIDTILKTIQHAGNVQVNGGLIAGLLDAGNVNNNVKILGEVSQDNLVLAALTLLLADAQDENYMDVADQKKYLENFENKKMQGADTLTDKQKKATILAKAAMEKNGVLTDMLKRFHLV